MHVYIIRVASYSQRIADLVECLSLEERMRARYFFREDDRRRFLLGRAMVRRLCANRLGVEAAAIILGQATTGKPYIASPLDAQDQHVEFNVAHSGDCVIIALSKGQPVGVDVELLESSRFASFDTISLLAFSEAERAALSAAVQDQLAATFYRIWVRKEAVIKAEGCGIGGPLQSFSVARKHAGQLKWIDIVYFTASGRIWKVEEFTPAANHFAALAVPRDSSVRLCTPADAGFL